MLLFLLLLSFCSGCTHKNDVNGWHWQIINGRNGLPIYRVQVDQEWQRQDPSKEDNLADTTKSLCEFYIREGEEFIRISIHNFPSESYQGQIPPYAQVERWQKQFQKLHREETTLIPQAFSGFSGLLLQATGWMNNQHMTLFGWSMTIAPEHYQALAYPNTFREEQLFREMRSSFTIKILGSSELMQKYDSSLLQFARSFELIQEIPTSS